VRFLLVMLLLVSCGKDLTKVVTNDSRVTELERRADLNDQLDAAQSALIAAESAAREASDNALSSSLEQEILDRAAGDAALQDLIDAEAAAREAGDIAQANNLSIEISNRINGDAANSAALAIAAFTQSLINFGVQVNISQINNKIVNLKNRVNNLEDRMDDAEDDIDDLESDTAQLASDMASLQASLQAEIDDVAASAAATQAQLNAEGVKVFKCNAANSSERILKINGKFYAAMNRVTKQTVSVTSGSSSQTYTTPDLCETFSGDLEMPNSAGNCTPMSGPFKSTKVPGQSIVVPAYTTSNVSLVSDVKIAIDILKDGSYATTDGGPACNFSISGSGSVSSNLIQVQ
jgi:FtsZ-binding cell division protein ZapB